MFKKQIIIEVEGLDEDVVRMVSDLVQQRLPKLNDLYNEAERAGIVKPGDAYDRIYVGSHVKTFTA